MTTTEESYPPSRSPTGSDTSSEYEFDLPSTSTHAQGLGIGPISSSNNSPPKSLAQSIKPPSPTQLPKPTPLHRNANHPNLPKSQPLSRTLFARMASGSGGFTSCGNDVPHAGSGLGGNGKKKGPQKIIVPTKGFRTTFELGLTSSEFARK